MEPQTSSFDQYKQSVITFFNGFFDNLKNVLCGPSLENFTGKLYSGGLIGFDTMAKKDFTTAYGLFITGIILCKSVEEIQDKRKIFTESLKAIGGPAKTLGEEIDVQFPKD